MDTLYCWRQQLKHDVEEHGHPPWLRLLRYLHGRWDSYPAGTTLTGSGLRCGGGLRAPASLLFAGFHDCGGNTLGDWQVVETGGTVAGGIADVGPFVDVAQDMRAAHGPAPAVGVFVEILFDQAANGPVAVPVDAAQAGAASLQEGRFVKGTHGPLEMVEILEEREFFVDERFASNGGGTYAGGSVCNDGTRLAIAD